MAANKRAKDIILNILWQLKHYPQDAVNIVGRAYRCGILDGSRWETTRREGKICLQCDEWFQVNHQTQSWADVKWCPMCGCDLTKYPAREDA